MKTAIIAALATAALSAAPAHCATVMGLFSAPGGTVFGELPELAGGRSLVLTATAPGATFLFAEAGLSTLFNYTNKNVIYTSDTDYIVWLDRNDVGQSGNCAVVGAGSCSDFGVGLVASRGRVTANFSAPIPGTDPNDCETVTPVEYRCGQFYSPSLLSFSADFDVARPTAYQLSYYVSGVPEPTTWAMMIAGCWAVGAGVRKGRARRQSLQRG